MEQCRSWNPLFPFFFAWPARNVIPRKRDEKVNEQKGPCLDAKMTKYLFHILEKVGAPMTNTTTEKLGAKRSLTYQRLHLSIP